MDLDEPRLTHVVVDKRDESRRVELIKRTAKCVVVFPFSWAPCIVADGRYAARPKRRHLVISEYIQACLDEATLLDEDGKSC